MTPHFVEGDHPFRPATATMQEILRKQFIPRVVRWLLGRHSSSILAQESGSAWETALSLQVFVDALTVLRDTSPHDEDLETQIGLKSMQAARWLLSVKYAVQSPDGEALVNWENVTWDTSVVIRGLLTVLKESAAQFSSAEQEDLKDAVVKGTRWLLTRFDTWHTDVKYPFGPADVSQIVITLIYLARTFPDLYARACSGYKSRRGAAQSSDPAADIITYLLHTKTKRTLPVHDAGEAEEVAAYWWDDYFSTAEVVEALATYYELSLTPTQHVTPNAELLVTIKTVLVGVCAFFEHTQCDGMWGSHVETLKVTHCYIALRRCIPELTPGGGQFLVPEIHTTFKAIRWMCDPKQIFADGSFLHTMFLTIFYSRAVIEVYRSWPPARSPIEKLYDDVVWFSPVRTTPERSRRHHLEIRCAELTRELDDEQKQREQLAKWVASGILGVIAIVVTLAIASSLDVVKLSFHIGNVAEFVKFIAIALTLLSLTTAAAWKLPLSKRKT